jgi:lipid II:glycine glycyltransferase (peptidoglycan interpeptide bridge formation enzyme)
VTERQNIYAALCRDQPIPLQAQDWWLTAVGGAEHWDAALSYDEKGNLIGAMPYTWQSWMGQRLIRMPVLTSYLHIWLRYPDSHLRYRHYGFEKKVLSDLIDQLPAFLFFDQQYTPVLNNWLPFHWKGFRQTTRYTYLLEDLSDLSRIHRGMESSVRTHIRKAKDQLEVIRTKDLDGFYAMLEQTFDRQQLRVPFSKNLLQRLDTALNERDRCRIYMAKDKQGRIHAAAYILLDDQKASYLLSGTHPELRKSGAAYFLLWEIIKDCARQVHQFDFEGSMQPQLEAVFRSFGGVLTPYLRIQKSKNRFWEVLRALKG